MLSTKKGLFADMMLLRKITSVMPFSCIYDLTLPVK